MTGPTAPTAPLPGRSALTSPARPLAGRWFGLWVDLGDWHTKREVWLRVPSARFTCRYGCLIEAFGADDVAELTKNLNRDHARICPGPTP